MVTKVWRVYGRDGHRQRESFGDSMILDLSPYRKGEGIYTLYVENSDITGTNDYTIIRIVADDEGACDSEFYGQLSDGVFENSAYGKIEVVYCITHE